MNRGEFQEMVLDMAREDLVGKIIAAHTFLDVIMDMIKKGEANQDFLEITVSAALSGLEKEPTNDQDN